MLRRGSLPAVIALCCVTLHSTAEAQGRQGGGAPVPDSARKKVLVVAGQRAGPSAFPYTDYPETRPLVPGVMDFKHYHTSEEIEWWMRKWATDYPNLVELYEVAQSFAGTMDLRYLYEPVLGLSHARNAGWRAAAQIFKGVGWRTGFLTVLPGTSGFRAGLNLCLDRKVGRQTWDEHFAEWLTADPSELFGLDGGRDHTRQSGRQDRDAHRTHEQADRHAPPHGISVPTIGSDTRKKKAGLSPGLLQIPWSCFTACSRRSP